MAYILRNEKNLVLKKISLVGALGLETILVPKWDQDQVFVAFVAK